MQSTANEKILHRAMREVKAGMFINLGFGLPTKLMDMIQGIPDVMVHSENGILGLGSAPIDGKKMSESLINPAGEAATLKKGGSYFDSNTSFALIRRQLIDIAFLGALQVSHQGDLASWIVPGQRISGMGGARELAYGAKRVIVLMRHFDPNGAEKFVEMCTYPLTAEAVVDLLITERGVFEKRDGHLICTENWANGV